MNVIGTCSECGGPVVIPETWSGLLPPKPSCLCCHAQLNNYGPEIKMEPITPIKQSEGTEPEKECTPMRKYWKTLNNQRNKAPIRK